MAKVTPQPLLSVRDVPRASRWYQRVLGAESGHGGDEYERIVAGGVLVLQLHALDQDHHHGALADPRQPFGNGVAVWFELDDLDAAAGRAASIQAAVEKAIHVNPNAHHRELWLRDLDGYLVVLSGA
jgi:catechol 2,3-dioxygenase-like lactoylglutathione lyase family enzyme